MKAATGLWLCLALLLNLGAVDARIKGGGLQRRQLGRDHIRQLSDRSAMSASKAMKSKAMTSKSKGKGKGKGGSPDEGSPDEESPDEETPDEESPDDGSPEEGSPDDGTDGEMPSIDEAPKPSPTPATDTPTAAPTGTDPPVAGTPPPTGATDAPEELGTIVDVVAGNPDFSILADLLDQAGLADVLSGDGPFTLFAPTNDAFAALDQETLDAVGADMGLLTNVLLYHVVEGTVLSSDLVDEAMVPTVNGANVTTFLDPPRVNNADITEADILASNGVIHAIAAVSYLLCLAFPFICFIVYCSALLYFDIICLSF